VVELDGEVHSGTADYDRERDAILAARGLRVLRFPNVRLAAEPHTVLAEIESAAYSL
jgi:very-short-patch-repair endonuclease